MVAYPWFTISPNAKRPVKHPPKPPRNPFLAARPVR